MDEGSTVAVLTGRGRRSSAPPARWPRWACALLAGLLPWSGFAQTVSVPTYTVVANAIPAPLSALPGDAARGRAIVVSRRAGLCLLCHAGPFPEEVAQGTLAPTLAGVGRRLTEGQLRLRLVDSRRINRDSIMPSYLRTDHLTRVGTAWQGLPVLTPQQIEDVVALLRTLD